jgi:hypothetical protein
MNALIALLVSIVNALLGRKPAASAKPQPAPHGASEDARERAGDDPKPFPLELGNDLAGRIVRAMHSHGYRIDIGAGEVNIVYVEGLNVDGTPNDDAPNVFNDARFVIRFETAAPIAREDGRKRPDDGREGPARRTQMLAPRIAGAWEATTEPGRYWTEHRMNPKGAARIAFGQYRAWQVGVHNGHHEALVQTGGAVTVHRDDNEDFMRPGDAVDTGWFGINQHHGYGLPRHDLGRSSAGCLVGRDIAGHRDFMALVKSDPRYRANNRFIFTSTIIPAEWL